MKQYKVTIAIPVYNAEKFISQSLESALAQTFESIEFLILDDCGTDHSIDIVSDYQANHRRGRDIYIVSQPRNGGVGLARNRIIDEAQGKYLYQMDADDTIAPNTIELLYNQILKYDAQIVYGSSECIYELGNAQRIEKHIYDYQVFLDTDAFPYWAYGKYDAIQATAWNVLVDIDVYRKNGLRYQPSNYWEDLAFSIDLPSYIERAVLLPDITYYYHCRYGSLSNFEKRDRIAKEEIVQIIDAVNQNKKNTARLRSKPYFPNRMYKLMLTDFYIVCAILRSEKLITPYFKKREVRDIMKSPITLNEILHFHQLRIPNFVLYLFGILPPVMSVALMKWVGKAKKLI